MGAGPSGVTGSGPANDSGGPGAGTAPAPRHIDFDDGQGAIYRVALRRVPLWKIEALQARGGDQGRAVVREAVQAIEVAGAAHAAHAVDDAAFAALWDRWSLEDRRLAVTAAAALARGTGMVQHYLERLRSDPGLAAALAYCVPAGIPLTHFLGGPPGWDDVSRDAALAWQADQAARCGDCRQRRSDWMTPGPDGELVETVPPPFVVEDQVCPACAAGERASRARREAKEDEPGMKLVYRKRADDDG